MRILGAAADRADALAAAVLLPAELAARCQPVVRPIDDSDAAAAVALEAMYGLYGTCAGKHVDAVDYINKPGKDR